MQRNFCKKWYPTHYKQIVLCQACFATDGYVSTPHLPCCQFLLKYLVVLDLRAASLGFCTDNGRTSAQQSTVLGLVKL